MRRAGTAAKKGRALTADPSSGRYLQKLRLDRHNR